MMRRLGLSIAVAAALLAVPASAQAVPFSFNDNSAGVQIPETASSGASDPYPSTITVPQAGTVADVNVTLSGLSHSAVHDLDIAVQSPNGTFVVLMSDACVGPVTNRPFTFDQAAGVNVPTAAVSCNPPPNPMLPSNYDGPPEPYIAPGPTAAQGLNSLNFFNGGPSAGAWNLFIQDDANGDVGSIGGWTLNLDVTPLPLVTPVTPVAPVTLITPAPTCPKGKKLRKGKCVKKRKKKKK